MADMTAGEKAAHIWYCFKWHIIVTCLCLATAVSLITTMVGNHKETVIGGGLLNISVSETGATFLMKDYLQFTGHSGSKYQVTLYSPGISGMDEAGLLQNSDFTIYFMTMLGAKEFDYLILDETAFNYYSEQGLFLDLRTVFSSAELQNMESLCVFPDMCDEDGNTSEQMYPVGICIDSLPFVETCVGSATSVYLVFAANAPHPDKLADFYRYLCAWKPVL